MENKKFISFLMPTRQRVVYLKNSINSILRNLDNTSDVELIFRIDDDDDATKNIIKFLPFDNLYINGEKMQYEKNTEYDKFVDMHFIIKERGNGYRDGSKHQNQMYDICHGKWIFLWSDDVYMITENWYDEVIRLDSLNKTLIAKLSTWNICLLSRDIPDAWGHICPTQWSDLWYDAIAKELNLYEESNIEVAHNRVLGGSTSHDRDTYLITQKEMNSDYVDNTWFGGAGPKSQDTKLKEEAILKLKKYIESKNMGNKEFSNQLTNFFDSVTEINTKQIPIDFVKEIPDTIICNFINGPYVDILGKTNTEYTVEFIDNDTDKIIHRSIITPQHWTKAHRQWFTNWKVRIYTTELVYEHIYNAENKKVYIHLSSESIGDTLAWFPYVEEFRKLHRCKMVCSTFHNDFFKLKYPNIEFVKPGTQVLNLYAMYEIGIYDGNFDRNKNDAKKIPLQQAASDMLGLEFKEIRPNIQVTNSNNNISGKYVAIATESTAQCKYWNYPGGWQEVVNYLNSIGYRVVVIQKGRSDLRNIIDKTGKSLQDIMSIIDGAEFVMGISSGIPWLAWALQKKVIMISGFTSPWYEFNENCYRIYNNNSCKGCWHEHVFDKGNWNWCPMKQNFECSTTITPHQVITQIEILRNEMDLFYTSKSPDKKINLTNSTIQFRYRDNKFDSAASMYYEIFKDLTYNFKECKINKDDVVLDIGANIGVFSRYAIANGAKDVYSFEPIKENYDLLEKNSDGFPVVSFNYAISNKNGTENFHIDSTEGGHTILDKDPNNSRTKEIREIGCYTIDYLFEESWIPHKIDFMKIDVEGAEIQVLEGISDENLKKIDKIVMEWHRFLFDDKNLLDKIINRLYSIGFQFYIDYNSSDLDIIYFWK